MIKDNSPGTYTGAGILSAFAASLCCIAPVIAIFAGSSSIVSNFSWLDPARPYLIGLSITILAFAWYLNLKGAKTPDLECNCETSKMESFLHSKSFLSIVTLFAAIMMTFPLYAEIFYPGPKAGTTKISVAGTNQQAVLKIHGMTCEACEAHVNNELSKVPGVLAYKTSYSHSNTLVTFDSSKVDIKTLEAAIQRTGYKVLK